jgi:antitoxin StbD
MNEVIQRVEADLVVGISDLKKNPSAVIKSAEGQPVAILNHNRVVGYLISPDAFENILEALDDMHLNEIAEERIGGPTISVSLDDL